MVVFLQFFLNLSTSLAVCIRYHNPHSFRRERSSKSQAKARSPSRDEDIANLCFHGKCWIAWDVKIRFSVD